MRALEILIKKKLNFELIKENKSAFIIEFDVRAKPGSKVEKIFINELGELVIYTMKRPVEGEANRSVVEKVSEAIGIPKSNVEIIRGDKSKSKRIKILVEITANKDEKFFEQKFIAIESQAV